MSEFASDYLLPEVEGAHWIVLNLDPLHPEVGGTLILDTTNCALDAFGELDSNNCMLGSSETQDMRLSVKQSQPNKQAFAVEARRPGVMTFQALPLWLIIDKTNAMQPRLRLLVKRSDAAPIERIVELYLLTTP